MKYKKLILAFISVLCILIFLYYRNNASITISQLAPIVMPQELSLNFESEPESLDPAFYGKTLYESSEGGHIINNTFEGLVREINGKLEVGMAETYIISEDALVYTFNLKDSKWSDGLSVTAKDFELAWKRVLNPKLASSNAEYLYCIKGAQEYNEGIGKVEDVGVKALDQKTLQVELTAPTTNFLLRTSLQCYMPIRYDMVDKDTLAFTTNKADTICNGPFFISEYITGQKVVMQKNPNYWNTPNVSLEAITVYFNKDYDLSIKEYDKNTVDIIDTIPKDAIPRLTQLHSSLKEIPEPTMSYYIFNNTMPPVNKIKVRKALSMTIDRPYLIDHILKSGYIAAYGIVPLGFIDSEYKQFREKATNYRLDESNENIKKAQILMSESGYPEGIGFPTVEISYCNDSESKKNELIAKAVKDMWEKNLGIKVTLSSQASQKDLKKYINSGNFMISNINLTAKLSDPLDFLEIWSNSAIEYDINWSGSSFNQNISAAKIGWHPNSDSDRNLYHAEYRLMDDMVIIPLYQQSDAILVKDFVKNWSKNQMGYFWLGEVNIEYMYKDIEQNHFAYSAVKDLYEKKILDFHDGFYFNPDKPVTKSDVHGWLERSLRKTNIDKLMKEHSFDEPLTREQAAYYIVKAFKIKALKGSYSLPKDLNNAKEDYQDEIATLYKRGIANGLFGDYFQPHKEITNAEFAALLHTVLDK